MPKYLPPPHKFRPKTLDSTDTVDFTHFRRTVNRYCDYRRPSVYKFTLLMKNTGLSTMKKLGKFVSEAFLLRKSLLNNT